MPATHMTTERMEKTRERVTDKISRKQRSLNKAKTDHKKEEPPINPRRNKNPNSVGRTDPKKKAKPVVDPAFSKVEMPSLFCFSMNLQEIAPGMTKSRKLLDHEQKLKMRDRKRLLFTKKLHKMYQLAMAHQATFSRILAKHSDDFGPDMDPLGSVKVHPDNEERSPKMTSGQLNKKAEYQDGGRESDTQLSLKTSELMKSLNTANTNKEPTMTNAKRLVYIDPIFPTAKEMANSSNEPHQTLHEENDTLTNDLDMLSVEDSQLGEENILPANLVINNELLLDNEEELNLDRNISPEEEILSDRERKLTDNANLVQDEIISIPREENEVADNVFLTEEKKS